MSLASNSTISAPLKDNLESFDVMTVFLTNAMVTVVFFLGILCVQLVYSLMISDVEEKTYTFGMIRSMGLQKRSLIQLISMQSFAFSLPALAGGLIVAYMMNLGLRFFMYSLTQNASSYGLSTMSIILGVLVGILMPLFSNVMPI